MKNIFAALSLALALASLSGCAALSALLPPVQKPPTEAKGEAPKSEGQKVETEDGKYYLDDGPPEVSPEELANIPDARPKPETIIPATTRPYKVLGNRYDPFTSVRPYSKIGVASWYGRRYHGRATASGEIYDMFKMTAAHPLLPIPSYARVTRITNGKSVVVRINDRGPFLHGRLIDLSYAAASRLGIAKQGSADVLVEAILVDGVGRVDEADGVDEVDVPVVPEVVPAPPASVTEIPDNTPPETAPKGWYVQLGAFKVFNNAENALWDFSAEWNDTPAIINRRDDFHVLLVGPYPDKSTAADIRDDLCAGGRCGHVVQP